CQYEQGVESESESESDDDWDEDIEYENKKIHSSFLQRMQEAESTQTSHLRGPYSGSSRATQWRRKQRAEALAQSASGTNSITSYFLQEPTVDSEDTYSDTDDEGESPPFATMIDEITAYLANKDIGGQERARLQIVHHYFNVRKDEPKPRIHAAAKLLST
ncbi:hypothetical protein BGZ79_005916, partial [Entomortierella chlamydospora]